MKQTSVEWLIEKWLKYDLNLGKSGFSLLLKQAKEMEKEQIENAWVSGYNYGRIGWKATPNEYYEETFKHE
jgi:hypothetical protein